MPRLGSNIVVSACDVIASSFLDIEFGLCEYFELSEVTRFPVAQICFVNHRGRTDLPAELGFVHKPNPYIKNAFLELVIDPIHDLAMHTGVLFAVHNFPREQLYA
jgi:hypothetical protein